MARHRLKWLVDRAKHAFHILLRPIWGFAIILVVGVVLSVYQAVVLFALPPDKRDPWDVYNLVPHWQWGWYIVLASCVVFLLMIEGSYRRWIGEKDRADQLAARLLPRIAVYLDESTKGMTLSRYSSTNDGQNLRWSKWAQIVVGCLTDVEIVDCEALLVSVERLDANPPQEILGGEDERCTWGNDRGQNRITIRPGAPQNACLFALLEEMHPVVPIPQTLGRYTLSEGIKVPGRYRLKVVVTARDTPSCHATFIFTWASYDLVGLEQIE